MRLGLIWAPVCGAIVALGAAPAAGGPWTRGEGSGQVIVTTGYKAAPAQALFTGSVERSEQQAQVFAEYGLTGHITVGLSVFSKITQPDQGSELRIGGHVRTRLWSGTRGDVLSVQVEAEFPAESWLGDTLAGPYPFSATEIGGRLLYGRGWQTGWGDSFAAVEAGGEVRAEGLPDEAEFSLTLGHRPIRQILALFAVRAEIPIRAPETAQVKLAPAIAWTFWPFLGANEKKPRGPINPSTLALGFEYDVANLDDGLLVGISVWKPF